MLKRYEISLRAQRQTEAVLLSEQDEQKREELLRKCFGSRAGAILAADAEPMLILATDLLDRGDIVEGQQRWVLGWYKIWMTTEQYVGEFGPRLRGGSMDQGHIDPWMWEPATGTVVWTGLASARGGLRRFSIAAVAASPPAASERAAEKAFS